MGLAKKFAFSSLPYLRGRFRYFGNIVYFPVGSHIFERACQQGIYESDALKLILSLVEPGTTYFDVGANIGLLSVPVLAERSGVHVVSIDASPTVLPFLERTRAAARRDEWVVIGAAVGRCSGEASFWAGDAALNAYDGLHDTGRGGGKRAVCVPVRMLDDIWKEMGSPPVSVVKMDIEGGECSAIQGALQLITCARPVLVIEWNQVNLRAYAIEWDRLLGLCEDLYYDIYAGPHLIPVQSKPVLRMVMAQTETFVLVPRGRGWRRAIAHGKTARGMVV